MQLFKELVLEGEDTVLQDQFQELHYLILFKTNGVATSAILKHCKDFHHPLPSISDFNIIDKDPSQITREAKEAIHIRRLDPNLNRNIGKMSIPHCFDPLLGAKPKHP